MDKIKLPREDYEELKRNEESNPTYWKQYTLKMYLDHGCTLDSPFETILFAMVHGYEVEETPEDRFKQFLKELPSSHLQTALNVINIFDIKVKGISDHE